jgi:hypothetical protein
MYVDLDLFKGYQPECIEMNMLVAPGSAYSIEAEK